MPSPLARAVPFTLAAVLTAVALGTPAPTLGAEPLSVPQLIAAAEAGDAQAQADLAWRHWFGDGVEQDRELGVRWFRRAADQGHGEACYWLGSAYEEGIGVTADPAEAARWYRRGAEAGDPNARVALGLLLAEGRGMARDDAAAVRWFRAAAEDGVSAAKYHLAEMYLAGRGVEQDPVRAVALWKDAAALGFAPAWNALGSALEHGRGVPGPDPVCAYSHYTLAADGGHPLAAAALERLEASLSPAELAEGRRLANLAAERLLEQAEQLLCPREPLVLRFEGIPAGELVGLFTVLTGLPIQGAEGLTGEVRVDREYPAWDAALTDVLAQVGRRWERRGDVIHVLPATSPAP